MKLLVAGGRNYFLKGIALEYLNELHKKHNFTALVNGMATGVDYSARVWAIANNIPVKEFPAEWHNLNVNKKYIKKNKYGKLYNCRAGLDRNFDMAIEMQWEPNNIAIIFPGGSGSKDMLERCKEFSITIIDFTSRMDYVYESK